MSGMQPCINTIGAFREHSYSSICSHKFAEQESMFRVSGLETEQTLDSIEWIVTSGTFTATANGGLTGNYQLIKNAFKELRKKINKIKF